MQINSLLAHVYDFITGENTSVQWTKDAETLLDIVEHNGELDSIIEDFQENLSIYSPGGGGYLIDEIQMKIICIKFTKIVRQKMKTSL